MVSLWWVTYPSGKWWSHYDGWPTQVEKGRVVSFLWVTYPGGRMASLSWVTYPSKKNGEWSHSNGWPTQKKNDGLIMMGDLPKWKIEKIWSGLIVMGDLPRKNDVFLFFCFSKKMISLLRVTYPKIECDLPGKRLGWSSPDRTRLRNLAPSGCRLTWRLLDDGVNLLFSLRFSYWQGSSHSLLVPGSKPNPCHHQLNDSFFVHNLAGLHWGSFCNKS